MDQRDPVQSSEDFTRVNSFLGFKKLAIRPDLSNIEKIGFPNSYREDSEEKIFEDIADKLLLRKKRSQRILDIGSGCSSLPLYLITCADLFGHKVTLLDSMEMHSNLSQQVLEKSDQVDAKFPECTEFIRSNLRSFDSIICYSVFQYPFLESNGTEFLQHAMSLLSPGGRLLIGDVPNTSMRQRFLNSSEGKNFLKNHPLHDGGKTNQPLENPILDDLAVLTILTKARNEGFHSFIVPQNVELPMSNRREDILIVRP